MHHIVVNPVAGHGKAAAFVQEHVVPLLEHLDEQHKIWTTISPRHAGESARQISRDHASDGDAVKVIIAGGDGTAHELIEGVMAHTVEGVSKRWELVILPLGTANALHASLFAETTLSVPARLESVITEDAGVRKSLASLIASLGHRSTSTPKRLPIACTTILGPKGEAAATDEPVYSHIVTSTSLHAALLQTSEELRAEFPGLERFKMAAERNLGVFFQAKVKLLRPAGSSVKQYDPQSKSFIDPYTTDGHDTLEGPFTYLLATTVCERLESTFVINPTLRTVLPGPTDSTMDIVILRPLRDPDVRGASRPEQVDKWKKRAMEVIGAAYRDGAHVDLTYPDEGGETVSNGPGQIAVETFRVGGFEWTPTDPSHTPSHLVCSDGAIHTIPAGGSARVQVTAQTETGPSFWVWA